MKERGFVQTPGTLALIFLLISCAHLASAYRYAVFVPASTTWQAPVNATDISVTLWGGGGGAAVSARCGAGGGSGSVVLNRTVDMSGWNLAPSDVQWIATIGQGGAALPGNDGVGGTASDGGETFLVALAPNGTQLYRVSAYGGGGGTAVWPATTGCRGGGGGGQASSAVGPSPGAGTPPGASDSNPLAAPTQGTMVGDVKAGGAGAGYGYANGNVSSPFLDGASWTSPGRQWAGGKGYAYEGSLGWCYSWGGAAGFNGDGGRGAFYGWSEPPPANSGAGGSSDASCPPGGAGSGSKNGAAGGMIIEYNHPMGPTPSPSVTPSRTPSSTPTRSPTPPITPSGTPQPLSQLITLVSPISGRQLTAQDDGGVASLWYVATSKERWTAARLLNGKYTFKSYANRYLSANPGGWVRSDATSVGSWEQWDVIINAGNQWTLKSVHGTYMGTTAAGVVYLNGDASLYWTKTTI
nr:fascin-like domain motif-containing [Pandoravirus massiliensis]